MTGSQQFPSLKRGLLKIHRDLDTVVEHSDWWGGYGDLSELEVLVLLLEDRRYLHHRGIDWRSIIRELLKAASFQRHGGASTIDMQYVRTKTGFREKTIKRKLYEMVLAYFLQYRMGKLQILRSYLSIVYLGSGLRGISAAARKLYRKSVWELTRDESAVIAAMMVYPRPLIPTPAWERKVFKRAKYGLRLFDELAGRYKQRLD